MSNLENYQYMTYNYNTKIIFVYTRTIQTRIKSTIVLKIQEISFDFKQEKFT